jgi:hypothetical protein
MVRPISGWGNFVVEADDFMAWKWLTKNRKESAASGGLASLMERCVEQWRPGLALRFPSLPIPALVPELGNGIVILSHLPHAP